MKRLLILQNVIPPYRKPVYNGLARSYNVTVAHSGSATAESDDLYQENLVRGRKFGPFILQKGISSEILSGKYNVIISMFDLHWPSYIFPVFGSQHRKERWIFWGHGYGRGLVANCMRNWLIGKADAMLLYSKGAVDDMTRKGIHKDKLFVAENTIHIPNHCDYSKHPKNCLLFAGVFNQHKGVDFIIDTFSRIRNKIPDHIRLEIIGHNRDSRFSHSGRFGNDREACLKRKIETTRLENRVVLHGRLYQHDLLADIFARSYAYISPLHVGLGVLHSFAYGVPVITNNVRRNHAPEFENLQHRHNSILYETREQFEDALIEMCNSPQLTSILGENAYFHYSRKRTLDIMLNGFVEAIEA